MVWLLLSQINWHENYWRKKYRLKKTVWKNTVSKRWFIIKRCRRAKSHIYESWSVVSEVVENDRIQTTVYVSNPSHNCKKVPSNAAKRKDYVAQLSHDSLLNKSELYIYIYIQISILHFGLNANFHVTYRAYLPPREQRQRQRLFVQ